MTHDDEHNLIRSAALQNSRAVLQAQERVERELRESNERIAGILESITDAFVVLDDQWRFTYVNQVAVDALRRIHVPRDFFLGSTIWQEFPDLAGTILEKEFRRAKAENKKVEFDFFHEPLQAWFELRAYPGRDSLSVYFLDVTERRQAARARQENEEQLRRSEAELHALADSIAQMAWMANPNGDIFWYNRRWYEYTGATLEQMEGWGWQAVHDPHILPAVVERWTNCIRDGSRFEMEFPLRASDGSFHWFLTRAAPMRDAQGRITRWFGTNTNIDEQRNLLRSLSEARDSLEIRVQERTAELNAANRNLSDLSASLLHLQDDERRRLARELHDSVGQILAALGMNMAIVQSQSHKLDADAARAVSENAQLVEQASKEIRTISYLLHPPLLEIAGLGSALRWYVDGFSERSKIKVELEVPPEMGRLPGDTELAIFRVVQECLTNIHRHSGSLTAAIRIVQEDHSLIVRILDHGKGIPKQKQQQMAAQNRAGVGFAGMRERLKQLGGTLEIESGENGTVVSAILKSSRVAQRDYSIPPITPL